MYILIKNKLANKFELENWYTLDEALKLYALFRMEEDIEYFRNEEMQNDMRKGG